MKKHCTMALATVLALGALITGGCEDQAANMRAEAAEKKAKAAYVADYQDAQQRFSDAQAKERAGQLQEAQQLYDMAASIAQGRMNEQKEMKVKFTSMQAEAHASSQRVKDQMDTSAKLAAAKVESDKKAAELAKKAADAKKTEELKAAPTTTLTPSTGVGDPTIKVPAPAGTTTPGAGAAAAGGDDDPIPPKGGAAAAAGAADAPKTDDIFKPYDEKATFKCYKVVAKQKYAIAYVILKNTFDKDKKVIRFNCDLATAKGDDHWTVAAFYRLEDFKTTNWNDLDSVNPDAIGPERLALGPGQEVKLVLMSNMGERNDEYKNAVKLTGSVIWSDNSESNVINNN